MSAQQPAHTIPAGTFAVVPAFNEGERLGRTLRRLSAVGVPSVVVDDGSADDTVTVARAHTPYVLRHSINRGQGAALQTGIEFALRQGAAYIVTFDADGQHRVEDLGPLLAPIVAGEVEITLGSRFRGKAVSIPPLRRLTLALGVLFTRTVSRVVVTDAHNGLRAFSRRAASLMDITNDRMAHASELIDIVRRSGLPFCEVPVTVRYSRKTLAKGQSLRGAARIVFDYFVGRVAG
jgi:glycosyltransferase involved in cell wall biosynthesis